jgi:hypothetical protein
MPRPDPEPGRQRVRMRVRVGLVAAGVVLGLAGAAWQVRRGLSSGPAVGPWQVQLLAGSVDADALTRARVALGGLLALHRGETMYYLARHDSQGRALRSHCSWRVSGRAPAARWWSLTAYADDLFLFPDEQGRYSINGANARLDGQGRFTVLTGPQAPADGHPPWLPTPGDGGLVLALRVYNPGPALQADPLSLEPPRIEPVGACR